MVMNGGVDHAFEVLSKEQYAAAVQGFRYFGLYDAAAVLERATEESDIAKLNAEYGNAANDGKLAHAFRLKLMASPEAFAPASAGRPAA